MIFYIVLVILIVAGGAYLYHEKEIEKLKRQLHGEMRTFEDGRLLIINYINGKKEGKWTKGGPPGPITEFGYYKNDKRDGLFKEFWSKDIIYLTGYFKDNRRIGKWEQFYMDGSPKCIDDYNEKGELISTLRHYSLLNGKYPENEAVFEEYFKKVKHETRKVKRKIKYRDVREDQGKIGKFKYKYIADYFDNYMLKEEKVFAEISDDYDHERILYEENGRLQGKEISREKF